LVLSVPLAFFSGIGAGSKKGILFKGGLSIEALAGVRAVALDKTGTVTKGDFRVQSVVGGEEMLRLCAACESGSTHPVAVSICAYAEEQGIPVSKPETLEEIPGHGIRGVVEGRTVLCGNEKLMARFGISVPEVAGSPVFVAVDGSLAGQIEVSDTLKPDAAGAVKKLKKMGLHTAMLTGDRQETAEAVAKTVGIDAVHARLLPDEKLAVLQTIRAERGAVMFVGDGINDAPVLAGADVGAAMGSGADAAIEAADVVFLTSRASAVPAALEIAHRTKGIAWQNVVFALAVKLLVMVLGLLGYASMWAAVFADSGVAMLCVLNAIRLLYRRK
jgi:Cd2+/Zn2+-exporting ATPase